MRPESCSFLVGGKVVDSKIVDGVSILIIEKTAHTLLATETFYYEIKLKDVFNG